MGDLVMINKGSNIPRNPIGIVDTVHKSKDCLVRSAAVRTTSGAYELDKAMPIRRCQMNFATQQNRFAKTRGHLSVYAIYLSLLPILDIFMNFRNVCLLTCAFPFCV